MKTIILSPAYGRDYNSKKDLMDAWDNGKDFKIESFGHQGGSYVSKGDLQGLKAQGFTHVEFLYRNKQRTHFLEL